MQHFESQKLRGKIRAQIDLVESELCDHSDAVVNLLDLIKQYDAALMLTAEHLTIRADCEPAADDCDLSNVSSEEIAAAIKRVRQQTSKGTREHLCPASSRAK